MTTTHSNGKSVTVAVIGTGEMGSAVAKRLHDRGARVKTGVHGRSATSRERIQKLGIPTVDSDAALVEGVDVVLSIIPPGEAVKEAGKIAKVLAASNKNAVYVDCNAISPQSGEKIAKVMSDAGIAFVDGGIVGTAPKDGYAGPMIFVSGSHAERVVVLRDFGLEIRPVGSKIGDASAVKMSYAGITKGCMAVCTTMVTAAIRYGVEDTLIDTLADSVPGLWGFLSSGTARMPPKAYRWIAEMQEIAEYTEAPNSAGPAIYSAASALYAHVAKELDANGGKLTGELKALDKALNDFLAAPAREKSKFSY